MKRISLILLWGSRSMVLSNVSFHGHLVQPPNRTIGNTQTIEITFQDVSIDDINGSDYEQTTPYSITYDTAVCSPLMETTLSWSGTPSDFDNAAVSSSITGLGIQLKQAGQSFTINTPLTVNETDLPVLTAVSIKKSGVVLPETDFETWATLQADYQRRKNVRCFLLVA